MTEIIQSLLALVLILAKIIAIVLPLVLVVAYLTFFERKVIAYLHRRIGPNRVGLKGFLQPIADVLKLLTKEIIVPTESAKFLFILAPIMAIAPSLAAWAVVPFDSGWVLANVNAGLLYIFAMTSLGVYGIIIGGWASNSKYAMFGAMRSAAQVISYEIAMGFALVGVLLAAGSMNLEQIVLKQSGGIWHWFALPLFPLLVVYWVSAMAETNRLPFDMAEGESEIVAGFHVEYSGMAFALFFLAEYANMVLVSALATIMFLGGWLSPVEGLPYLGEALAWIPGLIWFFIKTSLFLYIYLWVRATLPRYRYDQLMKIGWKMLIPVTLVWLMVTAILVEINWI